MHASWRNFSATPSGWSSLTLHPLQHPAQHRGNSAASPAASPAPPSPAPAPAPASDRPCMTGPWSARPMLTCAAIPTPSWRSCRSWAGRWTVLRAQPSGRCRHGDVVGGVVGGVACLTARQLATWANRALSSAACLFSRGPRLQSAHFDAATPHYSLVCSAAVDSLSGTSLVVRTAVGCPVTAAALRSFSRPSAGQHCMFSVAI